MTAWRSIAWLAVGAAALAACGGGDGGDDDARAPAATAEATPATTPAVTEEPTAAPAQRRRRVRLVRVARATAPLYVTAPPGDERRVFIVEQGGRIRVLRGGKLLRRPFLDIAGRVQSGGEQGLLSMAFAPDYADSGRFYVYFTDNAGDQRIVEYRRATADRAAAGSARLVLRMADSEPNHNGGLLLFGADGLLYVGTGDGGGGGDRHGPRGNAQSLGSLLGKILRIDPRASGRRPYRVPTSNPFFGRRGARGEIYAYGLRNPWRFAFTPENGLVIGDVGQNAYEEISFAGRARAKGANFGWRPFEGRARYAPGERAPGHVPPIVVRSHGQGWCSITGGVVVRDALPGLQGRYLFGDYCKGRVLVTPLPPRRAGDVRATSLEVPSLSSFGEDARRRVYVTSLRGPVYRLVAR